MRMTRGTLLATRKKERKGCSRAEENYTKNIQLITQHTCIHVGIRIIVHVRFADCFNGENREQVEMKL